MEKKRNYIIFAACLVIIAVGCLVVIGMWVHSSWATFVPDLIIGVVGAGVIAVLISYSDRRDQSKRARASSQAAAYERVVEALVPVGEMRFDGVVDMAPFRNLVSRFAQLADWEPEDRPALSKWLEAERQFGLSRMRDASERALAGQAARGGSDPTAEEWIAEQAPFLEWVSELHHNLRFWRTGRLDPADMMKRAVKIENLLTIRGRWRGSPLPWRDDTNA